ncbi:MAG: hypothetical protein WC942_11895 [Clostridia bacterium]|jgi:hypothetical protein
MKFLKQTAWVILISFVLGFSSYYVVDNFVVQQSWSQLDHNVEDWLPSVYSKADASALAGAFKDATLKDHENVAALVEYTRYNIKANVRDIDTWQPFLNRISEYCRTNLVDQDMAAHTQFWLELSASLKKVS